MKRVCIIAGILIAVAEAATAQVTIPLPVMPARKGIIQSVEVGPAPLTSTTTITCRMVVTSDVRFDKAETRRLGSAFMMKVYWIDPPVGSTPTSASTEHTESLGTLPAGFYSLMIQSLYKGRLMDTKQATFRVEEAPAVPLNYIDQVWIEPENPTPAAPVTLHISGEWPTSGYSMTGLQTMQVGNRIVVRMYWHSPSGNVLQVVTPYEREIEFPSLREDTYRAAIYCYRDNRLVDSAQMTFEVEAADEPE